MPSLEFVLLVPYSQKYWRSIKFGGLAVGEATVKFKSVKFIADLRPEQESIHVGKCGDLLYSSQPQKSP